MQTLAEAAAAHQRYAASIMGNLPGGLEIDRAVAIAQVHALLSISYRLADHHDLRQEIADLHHDLAATEAELRTYLDDLRDEQTGRAA